MERASSRGARDDCGARPAPRVVSVSWVGLPKRSPRGGFVDSIGRMIEPTWQVAVFVAFRLASALPTLRWPFAGALIALVADFADLFLMDAIGGISDYQRLDKLCDLGYIAAFLVVAARWSGLERIVAFALFGYRMIGDVAFELP